MGTNEKNSIQDTAFYLELKNIHRQFYDVLAPLSVALFGEEGHGEYRSDMPLFGTGMKTKIEDSTRSNIMYGIAVLLSRGMSMEDIFDPTKELEKKREAGELFKNLANNQEREKICEIYEKATERITEELDFEVKDSLLDNTRDVKNVILRKALFDINQRFGEHKHVFKNMLEERYKNQGAEDYKQKAEERYDKIYGGVERFQVLQSLELKPLTLLNGKADQNTYQDVLKSFEQWQREKEQIKRAHKEMSKEELYQLLEADAINLASLPMEFAQLDVTSEELLVHAVTAEGGLEHPLEESQVYKQLNGKTLQEYTLDLMAPYLEGIVGSPARPDSRIYIEDKPIRVFLVDRSEKLTQSKLAEMMTEAVLEGKTISVFMEDKATGRTMEEPTTVKVEIPKEIKSRLKKVIPSTRIPSATKRTEEQIRTELKEESQKIRKEEIFTSAAGYRTFTDISYKNSLMANEICKSIFGEEGGREIQPGDTMNLLATGKKEKGFLRYARTGVALGTAVLLSQGMSIADIMNPDVEKEKKLAAGKLLEELGTQGVEGRRKLALMAADAMEILYNEKHVNMSENVLSNVGDFTNVFTAQVMFDLNQEAIGKVLNLKDAYEDKFKKENPELSQEELNKKVNETYERVGSYVAPYQMVKSLTTITKGVNLSLPDDFSAEFLKASYVSQNLSAQIFSENMYDLDRTEKRMEEFSQIEFVKVNYGKMSDAVGEPMADILLETGALDNPEINADLAYQQASMKKMYEALEAVDPAYLRSSAEFRGMKAAMKDILGHYEKAGQSPSMEWRSSLVSKYQKLEMFNSKYLKVKDGLTFKEGSNGQKRYDVAKRIEQFTRAAVEINGNTNAMISRDRLRTNILAKQQLVEAASRRCDVIAGPVTPEKKENLQLKNLSFEELCLQVKSKDNDFKVPESLGLSEKEAGLLSMLSVGTTKVSAQNQNVPEGCDADGRAFSTVSVLVEDIFNQRDGFDKEKMILLESGRKDVKDSLEAYAQGNKEPLGRILAEGLTRFTSTFSSFDGGIKEDTNREKKVVALKKAAEIYDMLTGHPELVAMATNEALGPDKLIRGTLETYRGAKIAYEVHRKAEESKLELLDVNWSEARTPEKISKIKMALADITMQNIIAQDMAKSHDKEYQRLSDSLFAEYGEAMDIEDPDIYEEYKAKSFVENTKLKMSENLKHMTPESLEKYRNKLANSKTIEQLARGMEVGHAIKMLDNSETIFATIANQIKEKEPAILKEKELNLAVNVTKGEPEMTLNM